MKICPKCQRTYDNNAESCFDDGAALDLLRMPRLAKSVGSYRLLGEVGRGGMGTVYRAEHMRLKEERALKIMSAECARDPEFADRFKAEAAITRQLRHPNIVRVEDAGQTADGLLYLAMEFVHGQNLAAIIRKEGHLTPIRALGVAVQVCSALELAHDRGIVHRDIKPDNLLVTRTRDNETIRVVDFGIAKVRDGAPIKTDGSETRVGVFMGAPHYCSPEQAEGKSGFQLDGRSDLYSLGVVIYEMVTGNPPFSAENQTGLLIQQIQTVPTPPSLRKPDLDIPGIIDSIVMKALQKDVSARFQSAGEMQAALKAAITQLQPRNVEPIAESGAEDEDSSRRYLASSPTLMRSDALARPAASRSMPYLDATTFHGAQSSYKLRLETKTDLVEYVISLPSDSPLSEYMAFLSKLLAHAEGRRDSESAPDTLQVMWNDRPLRNDSSLSQQKVQPGDLLAVRSVTRAATRSRLGTAQITQRTPRKKDVAIEVGLLRKNTGLFLQNPTGWTMAAFLATFALSLLGVVLGVVLQSRLIKFGVVVPVIVSVGLAVRLIREKRRSGSVRE